MPHPIIWIATPALAAMTAEARRTHPDETGGMLLGWTNPDRNETVIATIVGPGRAAEHHPTRFVPDATWQQIRLERLYLRTDGKITYLGDWHVHPAGGFAMSRRDRRTMRTTAMSADARCPKPLMALLAGTPDRDYRFGVWIWRPSRIPFHPGHAETLKVKQWEPTADENFWTDRS